MSAGRPKSPHVDLVEANVNIQAIEVNRDAVDTLGMMERLAAATQSDDRDEFNQMFAEMRLADAYEGFSRTVRISRLKKIKENKTYRFLKGKKIPDVSGVLAGTWEEFCRLAGKSVAQVDEEISNFKTFGEKALDAMTNAGIGFRDLRQFRKLPEDQRAALIQVAQAGDKDELQELAEELIAKADAEKAAAKAEAEAAKKAAEDQVKSAKAEAAANLQAKDQLLATVRERANKAEEQLSAFRIKGPPTDKNIENLNADIARNGKAADDALKVIEMLVDSIDEVTTLVFDQEGADRAGAVALIQRTRDQALRLASTVGRIQAAVDMRLMPAIEGLEHYIPYTTEDGRPSET